MNYYLLHLQFLGFRFHGWQKQIDVKTVQLMLDKTLFTVFKHDNFKTLGASRTDSMVSANHHFSQLATPDELDFDLFIQNLNENLPQDLKILKVEKIPKNFNLLNRKKIKEYHYNFSTGEKTHPFCSPYMTNFLGDLDLDLMKKAAKVFEGEHNFIQFCYRGNDKKIYNRKIVTSEIITNEFLKGAFFPEESFTFKIIGEGFLRNQIRIMMGALIEIGSHKLTIEQLEESLSLENKITTPLAFIAPASGLILQECKFID